MSNETNIQNISMTVELLKEHNIRHLVISPGGTNVPFVKAVQDDPFFKIYSVVDERSALYFAIGLYQTTGEIIAMSCTSAQATRNYVPGLTEAFYKRVPILAITMEKHPRFLYQEYMQAPEQTSLPNDAVKKTFELPYISDQNDVLHSKRLINEAILELTHNGIGPVQLCIPWLDFPQNYENINVNCIKRYDFNSDWSDVSLSNKKVLVVIGEHRPFSDVETQKINSFCASTDSAVYVNHLSNFHGDYSIEANLALSTMKHEIFVSTYAPDIIISIGGQTGDYPLYQMLSKDSAKQMEHWRVAVDGAVVDTYDCLTKVFQCPEEVFFDRCTSKTKSNHSYFNKWRQLLASLTTDIELPFSNAYAAQKMHKRIPCNSYANFAILNSLRIWNLFDLNPTVRCFSNVGAFGIDGGLSTLIGQSMETDELCFMVMGDLSFCYDMNCLSIRHIKNNVRILLINNNGGIEFKLGASDNEYKDKYIAAAGHFKTAKGWAESCGFAYLSANSKNEFDSLVETFTGESDKSMLFEIFVSDYDEAESYHKLLDANRQQDLKDSLKKGIKSFMKKF